MSGLLSYVHTSSPHVLSFHQQKIHYTNLRVFSAHSFTSFDSIKETWNCVQPVFCRFLMDFMQMGVVICRAWESHPEWLMSCFLHHFRCQTWVQIQRNGVRYKLRQPVSTWLISRRLNNNVASCPVFRPLWDIIYNTCQTRLTHHVIYYVYHRNSVASINRFWLPQNSKVEICRSVLTCDEHLKQSELCTP